AVAGRAARWNVAAGHGRPELARAVAAQTRALEYAPPLLGFSTEPAIRLAARLARLAPKGLRHVMFTSGGSESNESVIRLVRLYWRLRPRPAKNGLLSLPGGGPGPAAGRAQPPAL